MSSPDEPADPSPDGGLVRVRLDIAYDGTEFAGWAVQPDQRTVQGVLQDALATVLRLPVALTVAGRTDAGVHATGQVAHLDLAEALWRGQGTRLMHRLGRLLPPDVRVRAVAAVPAEFDARFSALWRRYEYRICDREPGVDPLRRRHVLFWPRALDDTAMAAAAGQLLGLHDFVAFCKLRAHASTVRTLQELDIRRVDAELVCTVRADAFCHSMVRSLIGALLAVGDGRRGIDWPGQLLSRTSRESAVSVAPAHGLALVQVAYPPDDHLADRALRTRTTRTLNGRPR